MCNSQGLSCAAPHEEAVLTLVLPSRIHSAEVQNKKKSAFELCCFALSEKGMKLNSDLRHVHISGDFLFCFFSVIKLSIKHLGFIPTVKRKKKKSMTLL